jgi:nucleoid DNA-binding protein
MQVDLNQITKEVRDRTDVPLEEVRKYAKYMFGKVTSTMEEGQYKSIGLQYLGTFKAMPARLGHLLDKGIDIGEHGRAIVEQYRKSKDENNK